MKYTYVPDVMNNRGVFISHAYRSQRGASGPVAPTLNPDRTDLATYLVESWLPAIRHEVEPITYSGYESHVRNHITPHLGDVAVTALNRTTIRHFYRTLLEQRDPSSGKSLAKGSVERIHATLHRALAALVEAEVLERNPAAGARPRRKKSERYEARIWTPDELRAFLGAVTEHPMYGLWQVLAYTGVRRGEALGLKWEDIRLTRGVITIRRAIIQVGGNIYTSSPKSGQSRVIDIDARTIEILADAKPKGGRSNHDYVFCDERRDPLVPVRVSKTFSSLVRRVPVPIIRLHDLRHTHASHLLEAGANPKVVQERLGHADVVITLNIYSHLFPTTQERAVTDLCAFYDAAYRRRD